MVAEIERSVRGAADTRQSIDFRVAIAALQAGGRRDLRQQCAFVGFDRESGCIDQTFGRDDGRVVIRGYRNRGVDILRQHLGQWLARLQFARRIADDLLIGRFADLGLRLRRGELRYRRRPAGVCLRHVGARSLADLEARAGRARLLGQELQVLFGQHRDLAVADDIHVGAGGIEQRVLFVIAQALERRLHLRLGGPDIVGRLEAVEQHLVDLNTERAGGQAVTFLGRRIVDTARAADRRAPAGLGDRHVLVSDARAGPTVVQRRIQLVCLGKRAKKRIPRKPRSRTAPLLQAARLRVLCVLPTTHNPHSLRGSGSTDSIAASARRCPALRPVLAFPHGWSNGAPRPSN